MERLTKNISLLKKIVCNKKYMLLVAIYTFTVCSATVFIDRWILGISITNTVKDSISQIEDTIKKDDRIKENNTSKKDDKTEPYDTDTNTNKVDDQKELYTNISLNETISSEYWDFTLTSHKFADKVVPQNPKDYYSYYEVKDPLNTKLVISVSAKNIYSESLDESKLPDMRAIYDGKYEYLSFNIWDKNGDFESYEYIAPLTNAKAVYIFEVPKEVANSTDKSLELEFTFNGEAYRYKVR